MYITGSSVSDDSGVLTLSEGSKSVSIRNNKIIVTDNFVTCGTYVFKRGVDIPLAYFTIRRSTSGTNGSLVYNTTTDAVSSVSGVTYVKKNPKYVLFLMKALETVSSPTYKMSQVVSNVGPTSLIGYNEAAQFNLKQTFNSSFYGHANRAPTRRGNGETIPNASNAYNSGAVSGKNVTLTCKTNNNSFIVLTVRL